MAKRARSTSIDVSATRALAEIEGLVGALADGVGHFAWDPAAISGTGVATATLAYFTSWPDVRWRPTMGRRTT